MSLFELEPTIIWGRMDFFPVEGFGLVFNCSIIFIISHKTCFKDQP